MMQRLLAGVLSLLALGFSAPAQAQNLEPNRLYYESLSAIRLNPIGLQERASLYYRRRLVDAPADSLLFGNTWVGAGPTVMLSPAFARVGGDLRLEPIALLRFIARFEGIYWFGNFDQMLSWDNTNVDYSDSNMDTLGAAGESYATMGWQGMLESRVQAKVGPVAVRSTCSIYRTRAQVPDGDIAYYDQTLDILMPADGWAMTNDADVLYVGVERWTFGLRHTFANAVHHDGSAADAFTHRAGPLVARQVGQDSRRASGKTAYALVQWHLKHPYRTGQDVTQAYPLIVVGYGFSGDLLQGG
ncbi:MAG: hypothetical protein H6741_07270 [Alphaproteobacteria bacterium]|nr:hypothetical protein [Alphaproteobacteria bacterium]